MSLDRAIFDGGTVRPNGGVDYFVKDHLGSVRVIVDQAGTVREQNDYYPYGERCPESTYAVSSVNRYKFNGKEEQTVGDLGMLDYGARMYYKEGRIFLQQDRFAEKYYSLSPYQYAAGNPIKNVDINGDSLWVSMKGANYLYNSGVLYDNQGNKHMSTKDFSSQVVTALNFISQSSEGKNMIIELQNSDKNIYITHTNSRSKFISSNVYNAYGYQHKEENTLVYQIYGDALLSGSGGTVYWNPKGVYIPTIQGMQRNGMMDLAHEMFHALDANRSLLNQSRVQEIQKSEWQAVYRENITRSELRLPLRTHYKVAQTPDGNRIGGAGPLILTPDGLPIKPFWYNSEY